VETGENEMNAYELADELENYVWMNPNNNRDYCKEVKDMIRQQADRIAKLEDRLSMYEIKDLDRGIIGRTKDYVIHDLVHRTTPQIKELSDEEIWELHQKYIDEVPCGHSMKTVGFIEFAKAILKKASEK